MGASRRLALALLAPAFVVLSAAGAAPVPAYAGPGAQTPAGLHRQVHADTPAGRGTDVRHVGHARISAPRSVHLLAARLYWGRRPPSYPSTHGLRRDLRQTARYYRHVSRGRQHVHVRLTRWVHVPVSGDLMCNTQGASVRAATRALRRAGYHPSRYNRLMIFTEQCESAASAAQLPGRVTWIRFRSPGMATLVHELGHNMGLGHAYGLVCRQGYRRIALGGTCRAVEYGDSWDAMGHSRGFFSAPVLVRLGWAGPIQRVRRPGTYTLADVQHAWSAAQALRVRDGRTTYWVEYQPEHSPEVGRTIPGVMIRRQVGRGPVEIIDASPGNPVGIAYPDADLTNPALPVGSSLTTPDGIRFTTASVGRRARVAVAFHQQTSVPDAPAVAVTETSDGFHVHWTSPPDHGQIVLGYRVTAWRSDGSSVSTYVRSPAAYRTSLAVPAAKAGAAPTFTVEALNQDGWSSQSAAVSGSSSGPDVELTSPSVRATLGPSFEVTLSGAPAAGRSQAPTTMAWAYVGAVRCSVQSGPGPYTLECDGVQPGHRLITAHVQSADGVTDLTIPVLVEDG